jgi:transglutaminase-like putative cysteine protease
MANVATTTRWAACLLLASAALAAPFAATWATETPTSIAALVDAGQFQAADADITQALGQPGLDTATRDALLFQRERMRRIRYDFPLDADALKARIRKQVPDLRDDEFRGWDGHGLLERMAIDGRVMYFKRDASNIFRLSTEAAARRAHPAPFDDDPMQVLNDYHREVRSASLQENRSSVLPHRVRITQTLTVDADAVPAGKTVRAWIPYPKALPGQQDDIRYVSSEPTKHVIAPEAAPMRTVYFEKTAQGGKPTTFSVTYEVTLSAQYHVIDPAKVVPAAITPELAPYVAERAPHLVFTEQLRLFSRQVVGDEKNPYRIAQKLFAAVDEIPWAGAREYSTIPNLSDYTLHAGHGDCGQQTMLLIALLRLNGIPARWQSGAIFADGGYNDIHDWGQLYLAPYGWVPMDVTFGRLHPGAQAKAGDDALEWFYLGGLDAWRVAFNSDFGQGFTPAKQSFRSDNVDSQRGEVEWSGGNLYYDQWNYGFDWSPAAQH